MENTLFSRTKTGSKGMTCNAKTCGKNLENQVIYHWGLFIQSGTSECDGERHEVTLCETCYHDIEKQFVGHVTASNQMDSFVGYGGVLAELGEEEKNRLSDSYQKELRTKHN